MTEQNTPKKKRGKRKAKEVNETPIVAPEPIPTPAPEPKEEFVPETEPVAEYAEPAFVEEVRTSPATYANPSGEYIPNSFKRRRAERRQSR